MVEEKFYSLKEVAALLKVNYMTVFRWVKAKKLLTHKAGKQYRIEGSDLNKFLDKDKIKKL